MYQCACEYIENLQNAPGIRFRFGCYMQFRLSLVDVINIILYGTAEPM